MSSLAGGPAVLKDQVIHIPAAGSIASYHHFVSSFANWLLSQYMLRFRENCTELCAAAKKFSGAIPQNIFTDFWRACLTTG